MCGAEILDLPCLASGRNSNLAFDDMDDLNNQGISVNGNNDPVPENIPLTQREEGYSWILEVMIFLRQSNNLHNTYAAFDNYSRKEVMKMAKLELF